MAPQFLGHKLIHRNACPQIRAARGLRGYIRKESRTGTRVYSHRVARQRNRRGAIQPRQHQESILRTVPSDFSVGVNSNPSPTAAGVQSFMTIPFGT